MQHHRGYTRLNGVKARAGRLGCPSHGSVSRDRSERIEESTGHQHTNIEGTAPHTNTEATIPHIEATTQYTNTEATTPHTNIEATTQDTPTEATAQSAQATAARQHRAYRRTSALT